VRIIKIPVKAILTLIYSIVGNRIESWFAYLMINLRCVARGVYFYQPLYNVNNKYVFVTTTIERPCDDRMAVIDEQLKDINAGSFMDVGSQFGYFVYAMAEKGLVSFGIELSPDSVWLSKKIGEINKISNCGFLNIDVTPESVKSLPAVDIVSCMSVYHHWVRNNDFNYADKIMDSLCSRARKAIVFDTGQNDEIAPWASSLNFMGDDPKIWIEKYLKSKGFSSVKYLGEFTASHVSETPRHLFVAIR